MYMCIYAWYLCMYTNIYVNKWFNIHMFVENVTSSPEEDLGELLKIILKWEGLLKLEIMKKKDINLVTFIGLYIQWIYFLKMHKKFNNGCLSRVIVAVSGGKRFFKTLWPFILLYCFFAICIHYFNDKKHTFKKCPSTSYSLW